MTPLNCEAVAERLDLFAAGELDEPARAAVAGHLSGCAACAGAHAEARRAVDLLDLHFQVPDQLQRLRSRLRAEARPRHRAPRLLPFAHRAAALAALLLVTLGLGLWLGPRAVDVPAFGGGVELALVLVEPVEKGAPPKPSRGGPEADKVAEMAHHQLAKDGAKAQHRAARSEAASRAKVVQFPPAPDKPAEEARGKEERRDARPRAVARGPIEAARRGGRLPPAPEVELEVRLRNDGPGPLRVEVGGPRFDCWVTVRGPGVVTAPAPAGATRPFAVAEQVTIPAGQDQVLKVQRLVSRLGERTWYTYWTAPGEYVLTAHVRARAWRGAAEGQLELSSPPLKVPVGAAK
jgi:hypothetical protein